MKRIANPSNPYHLEQRESLEPPRSVSLEVFEETPHTILSRNDSPDLPFRWSLNPYRGCFHACAYCYARSSHEYWGFGAGTDFESKLIVKRHAAGRLRATFMKPSWRGEVVVFSGNTDCYQPLEATYGVTRACLEVCAEFRNPVGIITKSCLATRDLDLLSTLNETAWVRVYFSIPFADNETARKLEPQAPSISRRLEAMTAIARAGIPTAVSVAPIIPGLNEHHIPTILRLAREAGATQATYMLLRLNNNVEPVFREALQRHYPDRVPKVLHRLQEMRGGTVSESAFFARHRGQGRYWTVIQQLFELHYRKAGYHRLPDPPIRSTFRRPPSTQMDLFSPT